MIRLGTWEFQGVHLRQVRQYATCYDVEEKYDDTCRRKRK